MADEDPALTEDLAALFDRNNAAPLPRAGYKAKQTPHGRLKKACREALAEFSGHTAVIVPVHNLKVNMPDGRSYQTGRPGASDDLWLYRGKAFAVEYKAGKDVQSLKQVKFEQKWRGAGGIYIVARSPEQLIADVKRAL